MPTMHDQPQPWNLHQPPWDALPQEQRPIWYVLPEGEADQPHERLVDPNQRCTSPGCDGLVFAEDEPDGDGLVGDFGLDLHFALDFLQCAVCRAPYVKALP